MKTALIIIISLLASSIFSQSKGEATKKLGKNPVFFIDSIKVSKNEFKSFDSKETAIASVYYDDEAYNLVGEEGKDGVVYIETKRFAKVRYWTFFKSKSSEYLKIVSNLESDDKVQYILNGKILKENFEGKLALIDNKTFSKLTLLSKEELIKKYSVNDKNFGIEIITSD